MWVPVLDLVMITLGDSVGGSARGCAGSALAGDWVCSLGSATEAAGGSVGSSCVVTGGWSEGFSSCGPDVSPLSL